MPVRIVLTALAVLTACGSKPEPRPGEYVHVFPAKVEDVSLKALADKKLEMSFRLLDKEGAPLRVYGVYTYKVLECQEDQSMELSTYDSTKLATIKIDLTRCGAPPNNHRLKVELVVDGADGSKITSTAEVDATVSYAPTGNPQTKPAKPELDQVDSRLAELGTVDVDDTDSKSPVDTRNPTDVGLFGVVVARLADLGRPAIPKLLAIWKTDPKPIRSRVAAAAVGAIDPAMMVRETLTLVDVHDASFRKDGLKARYLPSAYLAAAGVHAAGFTKGSAVVDVYLRSLSSPDEQLATLGANLIKKQLARDQAVDALFRYMATKQEYAQREIDTYVNLVGSFGSDASGAVTRNLEALLSAGGSPAKVFWAHKVVAMSALQKIGLPAAVATVTKFKTDPGNYVSTKQTLDVTGNPVGRPEETVIPFRTLVEATLAKIVKH